MNQEFANQLPAIVIYTFAGLFAINLIIRLGVYICSLMGVL